MPSSGVAATRAANLALLGTGLGNVIIILDVTVVNVALQDIRASLGADMTGLQWIVSAYTLVFAALLLSGGALSDRLGARRGFTIGLAIFTASSLACGLSLGESMLTAARAVQGIGAALSVPGSLALLGELFPGKAERARAISLWGAIGGLSLAAGPVVGGALIHILGWRSVFLINVPIGLAAIWLTLRHARPSPANPTRNLDLPGQALALPAIAGVVFACIQAGSVGWRSEQVWMGGAITLVAAIAFVLTEARRPQPMLPLRMFRNATLNAGFLLGFVMNFAYYGFLFALSLYFQEIRYLSPLQTGVAFLPMTVLAVIVNLFSGRLIARHGPRMPLVLGTSLCTLGYAALCWMTQHSPLITMMVPMLVIGVGSALTLPAFTVAVMGAVAPGRAGVAAGVLNAARQLGGVLGVAIFGSLISATSFIGGLHLALGISAGLVCCAALLAFRFIRAVATDTASPELVEIFE